MSSPRLEALRAQTVALAAQAAAAAVVDPDEQELRDERTKQAELRAAIATANAAKRADLLADKLDAARAAAGSEYLVGGLDLYALFPADAELPAARMPAGGVIVYRNITPEAEARLTREIELRKLPFEELMADVVRANLLDPDPTSPAALPFAGFIAAYPPAVKIIATKVRELGGAKSNEGPRGRG